MQSRRRRHISAFVISIIGAAGPFAALAGCDDKPELPKEEPPAVRPVEIDIKHSARIKAGDRTLTLANLVLVLQPDPVRGGTMGVTLSSSRPALDGSRMIFGTFETADSIDDLAKMDIDFAGTAIYDVMGSGIFTPLGAYLPKSATIRITSHDLDQVQGTIRGEFYRHKPAQPTLHPAVVNVEATFSAKLVRR